MASACGFTLDPSVGCIIMRLRIRLTRHLVIVQAATRGCLGTQC